jgi:hypothetical protein
VTIPKSRHHAFVAAGVAFKVDGKETFMAKKFPLHPKNPERICWGCDKYCSVEELGCGNGSGRTQHPIELLGDDWYTYGDWGIDPDDPATPARKKSGTADA